MCFWAATSDELELVHVPTHLERCHNQKDWTQLREQKTIEFYKYVAKKTRKYKKEK